MTVSVSYIPIEKFNIVRVIKVGEVWSCSLLIKQLIMLIANID
jgi:hypothetical protein